MSPRRRTATLLGAAGLAALVGIVAAVARPDAPSGDTATPPDGRALFVDKGCAGCHSGPGTPAQFPGFAPPLDAAPAWADARVEGLSAEEYLTQSIVDPGAFVSPVWDGPDGPTTHMPTLALSDDEVAAIVEFLLEPAADGQG